MSSEKTEDLDYHALVTVSRSEVSCKSQGDKNGTTDQRSGSNIQKIHFFVFDALKAMP
jgi:hypothetical protein